MQNSKESINDAKEASQSWREPKQEEALFSLVTFGGRPPDGKLREKWKTQIKIFPCKIKNK